jgi:PHD/YefM family antitoxin component YafN of YafNO toxin-antitoxin module
MNSRAAVAIGAELQEAMDDIEAGYDPERPSTTEELLQARADIEAGRAKGVSWEEAKAAADAYFG